MDIFSKTLEIERKHNIRLHWGEAFKQAVYNDKMSDTDNCIIDKIELAIKHYPNAKELSLDTHDSDSSSPKEFCYAVVIPAID